jgi:hypothetical protein
VVVGIEQIYWTQNRQKQDRDVSYWLSSPNFQQYHDITSERFCLTQCVSQGGRIVEEGATSQLS